MTGVEDMILKTKLLRDQIAAEKLAAQYHEADTKHTTGELSDPASWEVVPVNSVHENHPAHSRTSGHVAGASEGSRVPLPTDKDGKGPGAA